MKGTRYFVVGDRPVRLISDDAGPVRLEVYDWDTGKFAPDWKYYQRIATWADGVEELVAADFERHLAEVRRRRPPKA